MYKSKRITIILVLLPILLNLHVIGSGDMRLPGICHAQTAAISPASSDQKTNMEAAKKLRMEAENLQKRGQLPAAIEKYEESQRYYADPKLADYITVLRKTLTKQYMEAAKQLRAEGAVLQKQGKTGEALEKYKLAQKYYPDPQLTEHMATLQKTITPHGKPGFELEGAPEGFKEELAAIERLKKDPARANIDALAELRYQYALSLTAMSIHKSDEDAQRLALVYAKSATDLTPKNPNYWSLLGQIYDRIGKDGGMSRIMAEDAFQKALELNPENNMFRLLLGQSFYRHRNFSSALREFETVLKRDSKRISPPIAATMCSAYIMDSRYSEGVAFFKEMLQKQPDADSARIALAILARQQKNNRLAAEELDKVIKKKDASEENRTYALTLLKEWKNEGVKP
jgi:tetratricopeptide (TPR) repeat protein